MLPSKKVNFEGRRPPNDWLLIGLERLRPRLMNMQRFKHYLNRRNNIHRTINPRFLAADFPRKGVFGFKIILIL